MSKEPKHKTIHQLRQQAQAKGVKFTFADDENALAQKINSIDQALDTTKEEPPIVVIKQDTKPVSDHAAILEALDWYIQRGLHVTFTDDSWHMARAGKEDTGTLHMPLITIIGAARRLFV